MNYNIIYTGRVQAQQRPRHRIVKTNDGRVFTQTYEEEKSRNFKASLHLLAQRELSMNGYRKLQGHVEMFVTIHVPVPHSYSKKRQEQALNGEIMPTKKPDVDNILKAVMDSLNGVLYEDDKQVCTAWVSKRFSENEGLSVYLLGEGDEEDEK